MSDCSEYWEDHSIDEEEAFQGGTSEDSEGSSNEGSSPDEREAEDMLGRESMWRLPLMSHTVSSHLRCLHLTSPGTVIVRPKMMSQTLMIDG